MSDTAATKIEASEGAEKCISLTSSPFDTPWKNSDAILVVEEREIHVHTTILSLASAVFNRMFNSSSFKESLEKKVELKDKKHKNMLYIIEMLYPQFVDLGKFMLLYNFFLLSTKFDKKLM